MVLEKIKQDIKNIRTKMKENSEAKRLMRKEKADRLEQIKNIEEESYFNTRYDQAKVIGEQKAKIESQGIINEMRKTPYKPYGAKGVILDLKKGLMDTF